MKLIPRSQVDPGMLIVAMATGQRGRPVMHLGRVEYRAAAPGNPRLWVTWLLVADRKSEAAWSGPALPDVLDEEDAQARARGGHLDVPEVTWRGVWLDEIEGDQVRAIGCEAPIAGEGLRGAVERALLNELGLSLARDAAAKKAARV